MPSFDLEHASEFERILLDIEIPPRPQILDQILRESRKDDSDPAAIAQLIHKDVRLSAGVIRAANAPYFRRGSPARNITAATLVLGLRNIANTVASLILRELFPPSPALNQYWEAAENTARLAAWLAQRLDASVAAEDAYTFALFRDCGMPILLKRFPNYPAVLEQAGREARLAFTEVENAALPTNHAVVGSLLTQQWGLPMEIVYGIYHHHDPDALGAAGMPSGDTGRRLAALAQAAEKLYQDIAGRAYNHEWQKLGAACLASLGLAEAELEAMLPEARETASGD